MVLCERVVKLQFVVRETSTIKSSSMQNREMSFSGQLSIRLRQVTWVASQVNDFSQSANSAWPKRNETLRCHVGMSISVILNLENVCRDRSREPRTISSDCENNAESGREQNCANKC